MTAFEAGLRKTLARMGISAVASYVGGALIDTLDLAPEVVPAASRRRPPGRVASRSPSSPTASSAGATPRSPSRRRRQVVNRACPTRFARFRGDGEAHLFAPRIVGEIQAIADTAASEPLETQLGRYGTRSLVERRPGGPAR